MQNIIENKPKKSFLNYINVFRGLAILLIVAGHTMQFGETSSLSHIASCEMVCGGTALFIFISGFLFQHLSSEKNGKTFDYKTYLSKKCTNVIMPYLITAIPGIYFCLVYPISYKNPFFGLNDFVQIPILLSIGRVHNTPAWFIPMIAIFFVFSWIFLKLEKKNILYKLLPVLFLVTIFVKRGDLEYDMVSNLDYFSMYLAYVKYIILGFVHFCALYIFGMYCSYNKDIIDKFYNKRFLLFVLMVLSALADIYLSYNQIYSNYTISKTFLTMLLLGYLKHFDNFILSHNKTNKTLDFIAKYSFGLFFIHWYWLFIFNRVFNMPNVLLPSEIGYLKTFCIISLRFLAVLLMSFLTLYLLKKLLLKINKNINTRMFLGL